ncbi:hypothetical protein JW872_03975 [Candidatus Babeliales bacterium]|nr:hypothetical protein [Candidatus Babeliales bacterium]
MKTLCAIVFVCVTFGVEAAILRSITNGSTSASILFEEGAVIPAYKDSPNPHLVPPRASRDDQLIVVDAGNMSIGRYLPLRVTEDTSLAVICKEYRIFANDEGKTILLQVKKVCGHDADFITLEEHTMDPEVCYVDISLSFDNVLAMRVLNEEDMQELIPASQVK